MRRRNMREARRCQNGARRFGALQLALTFMAATLVAGAGGTLASASDTSMIAYRAPAEQCMQGDIEITGWHMTSSLFPGRDHRTIDATLLFEVHCTPIAAQLEMRLQKRMKVHGRYEFVTRGTPDIYTASGDPPGTIFAMTRDWVCSPGRWQIFLHVLAGINHAGKAIPPENFYFPRDRKGYRFRCRRFQRAH